MDHIGGYHINARIYIYIYLLLQLFDIVRYDELSSNIFHTKFPHRSRSHQALPHCYQKTHE
jgi:hypothetical protein